MVEVEEKSKKQVERMLNERIELAIEADALDRLYPDVFCGLGLSTNITLQIHKPSVLKKIARILGKKIVVKPYDEMSHGFLGSLEFDYMYGDKKWRVFSLYENEKEAVE